jgi:hypothetical protein
VIVREGGDLDFFFAFIFLNKECFQQNNSQSSVVDSMEQLIIDHGIT